MAAVQRVRQRAPLVEALGGAVGVLDRHLITQVVTQVGRQVVFHAPHHAGGV